MLFAMKRQETRQVVFKSINTDLTEFQITLFGVDS